MFHFTRKKKRKRGASETSKQVYYLRDFWSGDGPMCDDTHPTVEDTGQRPREESEGIEIENYDTVHGPSTFGIERE